MGTGTPTHHAAEVQREQMLTRSDCPGPTLHLLLFCHNDVLGHTVKTCSNVLLDFNKPTQNIRLLKGSKCCPAQIKLHYTDAQEIADLLYRMDNTPEERNLQEK